MDSQNFSRQSFLIILVNAGFLSLYCGGTSNFTDSSNILWIPDSSYITTGNASSVNSIEGITPCPFPLRFFPSLKPKSLNCYRLPVQNMSLVLVRPQFIYKNYDGLMNPPSFFVSLGTAIVTTVNLTVYDPWVEEFVWPVSKENLLFCLHPIPGGGHPVISSLELRPLPTGAYILSQIRHQNLVSLEGFCHESQRQILVYEYLPGGSLADILYGNEGLDYLHNGNSPRIIHRDVKCSNILLDLEMKAKVSDFGLSKQLPQADITHVTTAVKGTAGYLDPEYYYTQQLNEKSDVYSFGVVLLELICGREPLCHAGTPDSYNLVLWVPRHYPCSSILGYQFKKIFINSVMMAQLLCAC
ncbi:putative LRR receptor-like serine/threonine-protein kinase [Acorus gramineus]|uniref:LRR receptor-like serine/threonine-protein kinase n=1 Tax=Acorus gramineus TaxID=55184 RepID=A0AAV9A1M4_ACOGR|nr:putative LRR receptor-like serine/threonine-protein kinase [Acorus gramineus]